MKKSVITGDKMKKILLIPLCILLLLTSCTQVVSNTADEIRLNKWSATLGGNRRVILSFKDDIGSFYISSKENKIKIKGLTIIDSDTIAIFDSDDSEVYRFKYSLKENKLKLTNSYGTLYLKRN